MRLSLHKTLFACLLIGSALAADRGGIQAVVFPRWNDTSVLNMVSAVNEVGPTDFELSQCPFFGGDGRWANTVTFLGAVNSATRVVGTFHLSFHTDQTGYDLAGRAGKLNTFLITSKSALGGQTPIARLATLVLSPQLEDYYDDATWKSKMKAVLDQMDEVRVLRSGKLKLRRSSMKSSSLSAFSYQRGATTYTFPVNIERHGVGSVPPSGIWSNDGDFVFKNATINGVTEDKDSMRDAGRSFNTMSLSAFTTKSRDRSGAETLWRPAYNLWRKEIGTINGVKKVTWVRDQSLPAAWDRVDSGTAFDLREKLALKGFLSGL